MVRTNQRNQSRRAMTRDGRPHQALRARPEPPSQSQVAQAFHRIAHAADPSPSAANEEGTGGSGSAPASVPQWGRIKWNSDMVKLLVSAVAYVDEDMNSEQYMGSRMGKWKMVSTAMVERGMPASPQQCEDKFHDLNKRYKRLTEILGRGTACDVVEQPVRLEQLTHLPANLMEEARKHLSSGNLYYEEMCSYHNRNRQALPEDPQLQSMLRRLARGSLPEDDQGNNNLSSPGFEEEFQMTSSDHDVGDEGEDVTGGDLELNHDSEEGHSGSLQLQQVAATDENAACINEIQIKRESLKKMKLKMQQKHLKWMRSNMEKDRELEKMRRENELMNMENEELELELELKRKEMEMGIKPNRIQ